MNEDARHGGPNMRGSTRRGNLRGLWAAVALALPLGFVHVMGGPAPSAQSLVTVCGYARTKAVTSTSVPVGTYCPNADDPRCRPSLPHAGVSVTVGSAVVADAFVCVRWD